MHLSVSAQMLKSAEPADFPRTPGNHHREQVAILNVGVGGQVRSSMPVLLLWAVPAVIVFGGVGYYLIRVVH
jgi:hypothetical protein